MKNTLLLMGMLCLQLTAFSQITFGIKGTTSTVITPTDTEDFVSLAPLEISRIAVGGTERRNSIGLFAMSQNDKLFVMADGLFTSTEQKFQLVSNGNGRTAPDPAKEFEYSTKRIRLIATGGVKYKDFRIGAGPEISFVVDEKENLSQLRSFKNQEFNHFGGFNFLLGYTFLDHIQLDVKYVHYFASIGGNYEFEGIPVSFDGNPGMLELSLGFHL